MSPNVLISIAIVILIVVFVVLRRKRSQGDGTAFPKSKTNKADPRTAPAPRPARPAEPPEVVFAKLRGRAFETTPESLRLAGSLKEDEPYAVVMEMGMPSSVVTLACFGDGDASLLYQTGGGITGGGAHETVRRAAKGFVSAAQAAVPLMAPTAEQPVTETGRVQFYALTPGGMRVADMPREDVDARPEFAALFQIGQEVVAQMRKVQEQRKAAQG
jgi:hypothetical protein